MTWYEERILPRLVNLACSSRPARKQRAKVVPFATGDILEVGFGSGLNLPFYDRNKVRRIWGLEPSAGMRRLAQDAVSEAGLDVEFIGLPCEEVPLDEDSVDTVLVTYTLCTIPEPGEALERLRRVLKPDGRLLFCEHGKAPDESVHRWQERLNPVWRRFAGGCNIHRDIPGLIEAAGFEIEEDNRMYIPGAKPLSYNYWGSARIR